MASDLGRHLKNGEIILSTKIPITTNLYSYTFSDYPFVNHHWGFGVLAFLSYKLVGFNGLTLLNAAILTLTIFLVLRYTSKRAGFVYVLLAFLIVLPLLTYRAEIRPETLSALFMVLIVLLLSTDTGFLKKVVLILLIQILWVNIHVFFVFGLMLTLFHFVVKRSSILLLPAQALACLVNPLGLRGALYPLQIFNDYGYRIVENQTPFLLLKVIPNPIYYYLLAASAIFFLLILVSTKGWSKSSGFLFFGLLSLIFMAGSLKMVRLMPYFGLFGLVTLAYCLQYLCQNYKQLLATVFSQPAILMLMGGLGFGVILILTTSNLYNPMRNIGLGLLPGTQGSMVFYKENNLQGPIFNNYDAGGYLIFYLYPNQKVFVDNRPEAYPSSFFTNEYVPMQEKQEIWSTLSEKYGFNTIYFYRHDYTPWAQPFLIERIKDPVWAPVYVDDFALILVKRVAQNQAIIDKYELPKSTFLISL